VAFSTARRGFRLGRRSVCKTVKGRAFVVARKNLNWQPCHPSDWCRMLLLRTRLPLSNLLRKSSPALHMNFSGSVGIRITPPCVAERASQGEFLNGNSQRLKESNLRHDCAAFLLRAPYGCLILLQACGGRAPKASRVNTPDPRQTNLMYVSGLTARLKRSINARGFVGTLKHYGIVLLGLARRYTPSGRREHQLQLRKDADFLRRLHEIDEDFDLRHQLDTGGKIGLDSLSVDSENKWEGGHYQAIFPDRFRESINSLGIEPQQYTFIDIGAGKGRALFLAQDMGFRRVIGVEFALELVQICQQNISRRIAAGVATPIEIVHADALSYNLPDEATVLYFYNPFGPDIMSGMTRRIRASLEEMPRPIKIVYENPVCDDVIMSGIPGLIKTVNTGRFKAYEWTPKHSQP
jgi:hypothetical protein